MGQAAKEELSFSQEKKTWKLSLWDGQEDARWLLAGWSHQKWEELGVQV